MAKGSSKLQTDLVGQRVRFNGPVFDFAVPGTGGERIEKKAQGYWASQFGKAGTIRAVWLNTDGKPAYTVEVEGELVDEVYPAAITIQHRPTISAGEPVYVFPRAQVQAWCELLDSIDLAAEERPGHVHYLNKREMGNVAADVRDALRKAIDEPIGVTVSTAAAAGEPVEVSHGVGIDKSGDVVDMPKGGA